MGSKKKSTSTKTHRDSGPSISGKFLLCNLCIQFDLGFASRRGNSEVFFFFLLFLFLEFGILQVWLPVMNVWCVLMLALFFWIWSRKLLLIWRSEGCWLIWDFLNELFCLLYLCVLFFYAVVPICELGYCSY